MDYSEAYKLINEKLRQRKPKIVALNTVKAFCKLFPPADAIWELLVGTKQQLDTERGLITQDVLLNMILAIDKKLNSQALEVKEKEAFEIVLEGIRARGDVKGLRALTSDPNLRQIFTEKEVKVLLRDIDAGGSVAGVDLTVDRELQLKKKLEIETDFGSVKFNPDVGEITFGKGLKSDDDE